MRMRKQLLCYLLVRIIRNLECCHMSSSSSSLSATGEGGASLQVRINRCCPPPEHWTKVKELNVENREPCEIWRSGVNHQLARIREHMTACEHVIQHLDKSMAASCHTMPLTSATPTGSTHSRNRDNSSVGTQTD